jgi:hypothetical protein
VLGWCSTNEKSAEVKAASAATGGASTAAANPNAGNFEVKSPNVTYTDDEITCKPLRSALPRLRAPCDLDLDLDLI